MAVPQALFSGMYLDSDIEIYESVMTIDEPGVFLATLLSPSPEGPFCHSGKTSSATADCR